MARVGKAAYHLKLPSESKIYPVFHASQLKQVLGQGHVVTHLHVSVSIEDKLVIALETVLETRYDKEGHLEGLVVWRGLPNHEKSWMHISDLKHQFPLFSLEDEVNLGDEGIDRPLRTYYRGARKQRQVAEVGNA